MTAAERAEHLRLAAPPVLGGGPARQGLSTSVSIGIAARHPGSTETIQSLMSRADFALHEARSAGPGLWRVSHEAVG
jgi:GGDEF domain-containing protein